MTAQLIAIRQYTRVVALTHNINQSLTESFLESAEFKDHITRRIQATFLDAAIPTYVRGSTARLIVSSISTSFPQNMVRPCGSNTCRKIQLAGAFPELFTLIL
jgi:hypothetical protein